MQAWIKKKKNHISSICLELSSVFLPLICVHIQSLKCIRSEALVDCPSD